MPDTLQDTGLTVRPASGTRACALVLAACRAHHRDPLRLLLAYRERAGGSLRTALARAARAIRAARPPDAIEASKRYRAQRMGSGPARR
jgi:hypothetical protein